MLIYDNYMPHRSAKNNSDNWRRALFGVYNAASKGDFREKYYELGRKPKSEGGTGRWATAVTNDTGIGAATVLATHRSVPHGSAS